MKCASCAARNCPIVKYVKPELLSNVSANKETFRYKKSELVFSEGNLVKGLYFIRQGTVKVFFTQHGENHQIRMATEGEVLGHRGLGGDERYPISAVVTEDAEVCFFAKARLLEILQANPPLAYNLTLFFARELEQSHLKLSSCSGKK